VTVAQRDITDRPIAVIGAGTLGRRIALMFATRGGEVRVFDTSSDQQAAALAFVEGELPGLVDSAPEASAGRVVATEDLVQAVSEAWLVVEALPERLDVKEQIFGELDQLAPPDAVLATNSSSYPSSQMIGRVSKPERVVNTHFYMPPISNAVEVMSCGATDRSVIDLLMGALPSYGLVPFEVREESVGFIYNRIWAAIKREALAVAAEGVATPDEIDRIFQVSLGAPYGPFRAMDLVGLDVVLDIEEHYATVREGIPEAPRRLLREYIDDRRLGVKSGRGFYDDYGNSAEPS
jgi:3-hydroxybutyryl-CoA dehydrogenase